MIKIICVGKIKEKFYTEAVLEYKKRISKYTKLEIIELPDSSCEIKKALKEEYQSILKYFNSHDYNILLDIKGEMLDSISLSDKINHTLINHSNITFIIGEGALFSSILIKFFTSSIKI